MDRFISIALVLFSAVVSVLSKQPHILFIVADDYGYHDIGYHNSEIKTPVLDDLAKKGVKLENYYVQPICTPTRSQLMSGRYQIHTGMQHGILWWTQPAGLPLGDPTLPDKLKAAGYSTHMIGKWHLGFWKKEYVPTHRGFDTFYGFYGGSETYYNHGSCASLEKGFCGYDFRDGETVDKSAKGKYSTHIFGERAVKVIKGHNTNKPMFMYMSFQAPHAPLEVPANYERQYSHLPDSNRRKYAGMVTAMDEAVGNITKALQEKHMLDDTIIVFTSDNGGEIRVGGNNYPLRGQKGSLFEGGMRAVGFVNSKLIPAGKHGTINHELIHVTDWYPTLVKLGQGNTHGTHLDGVDQWATISQGKSSPRTEILHNIDPRKFLWGTKMGGVSFDTRIRAALRKGNWKIITGEPGNGTWSPHPHIPAKTPLSHDPGHKNLWLFNIATDPEERHDVSAQHTDVVHQLLDRLHHYQSTAVPVVYPAADARSNPHLHGGVWGPWDSSPAVIVG